MIDIFSGRYAFLSSFFEHPVHYQGRLYPTREHAFAAAKTDQPHLRTKIAAAKTPNQAKLLGRQVKLISGWDQYWRYVTMESLIAIQFNPVDELAPLLLSTGEEPLIEGNTWCDNVWGDCRCGATKCKPLGMNLLGWMLMRQRTRLREDRNES